MFVQTGLHLTCTNPTNITIRDAPIDRHQAITMTGNRYSVSAAKILIGASLVTITNQSQWKIIASQHCPVKLNILK